MNDNIIKEVGIFACGVVVGIIATREYFKRQYKEEWVEPEDISEEDTDEVEETSVSEFASLKKDEEEKAAYELTRSNYSSSSIVDIDYEEREKIMADNEHPKDDMPIEPFRISAEDFVDTREDFEKLPLSYYEEDLTLVDENEELADITNTIGTHNCEWLVKNDNWETAYVRNPKISTDFEIFRVLGSYSEAIMTSHTGDE